MKCPKIDQAHKYKLPHKFTCVHTLSVYFLIFHVYVPRFHMPLYIFKLFYILFKCQLRAHQESKGGTLTMLPLYSHHKEKLMVMTHIGNTQDCSQAIEKTKNNQKSQRGHQKAQHNHWENPKIQKKIKEKTTKCSWRCARHLEPDTPHI